MDLIKMVKRTRYIEEEKKIVSVCHASVFLFIKKKSNSE